MQSSDNTRMGFGTDMTKAYQQSNAAIGADISYTERQPAQSEIQIPALELAAQRASSLAHELHALCDNLERILSRTFGPAPEPAVSNNGTKPTPSGHICVLQDNHEGIAAGLARLNQIEQRLETLA